MYFVKTPKIAQAFNKESDLEYPKQRQQLFLTFDDGPTPLLQIKH